MATSPEVTKDSPSAFLGRLTSGPAFLFLGQGYLALEQGRDPLLAEVGRRFDVELEVILDAVAGVVVLGAGFLVARGWRSRRRCESRVCPA